MRYILYVDGYVVLDASWPTSSVGAGAFSLPPLCNHLQIVQKFSLHPQLLQLLIHLSTSDK